MTLPAKVQQNLARQRRHISPRSTQSPQVSAMIPRKNCQAKSAMRPSEHLPACAKNIITIQRNLLQEQIEACHDRGIRVPVYTIQRDHDVAHYHPEWLILDEKG